MMNELILLGSIPSDLFKNIQGAVKASYEDSGKIHESGRQLIKSLLSLHNIVPVDLTIVTGCASFYISVCNITNSEILLLSNISDIFNHYNRDAERESVQITYRYLSLLLDIPSLEYNKVCGIPVIAFRLYFDKDAEVDDLFKDVIRSISQYKDS